MPTDRTPSTAAGKLLVYEWTGTWDDPTVSALVCDVEAAARSEGAASRDAEPRQFAWTMSDGHTLWRLEGTTVDEHDPQRCAKCQHVDIPVASRDAEVRALSCPDCREEVRHRRGCPRIPATEGFDAGFAAGYRAALAAGSVPKTEYDCLTPGCVLPAHAYSKWHEPDSVEHPAAGLTPEGAS